MNHAMASDLPRLTIYIEPELLKKAKELAKAQRRSVSALVCYLLEEAIKKDEEGNV